MAKTLKERYHDELAILYAMAIEQKDIAMALTLLEIGREAGEIYTTNPQQEKV